MLPCLNNELTLAKVIDDCRKEIPDLEVYVFDNGSTDKSRTSPLERECSLNSGPSEGKRQCGKNNYKTAVFKIPNSPAIWAAESPLPRYISAILEL